MELLQKRRCSRPSNRCTDCRNRCTAYTACMVHTANKRSWRGRHPALDSNMCKLRIGLGCCKCPSGHICRIEPCRCKSAQGDEGDDASATTCFPLHASARRRAEGRARTASAAASQSQGGGGGGELRTRPALVKSLCQLHHPPCLRPRSELPRRHGGWTAGRTWRTRATSKTALSSVGSRSLAT
jgi:hypothetical protein